MSDKKTQWRDAQKEKPEDLQFCVVIGETKTTNTISPYVAMYSAMNDWFQHLGTHRIFVPRAKARWWIPLETHPGVHPMDED